MIFSNGWKHDDGTDVPQGETVPCAGCGTPVPGTIVKTSPKGKQVCPEPTLTFNDQGYRRFVPADHADEHCAAIADEE